MSVYTISSDLLKSIESGEGVYLTDILFVFTNRSNPYKVAKDKGGHIIDLYQKVQNNGDIIKTWLDLMSFKPSPFETIDVDLKGIESEEIVFLKLCKETKSQNKLIVYTIQNINAHVCENCIVYFEGTSIHILDRDLARGELVDADRGGDTYINSQVTQGNSQINKSENKQ